MSRESSDENPFKAAGSEYNQPMDVIFSDASLVVVNKPAGIATNPGGWEDGSLSLAHELEVEFGHIWIVHRLDKTTSGLVVFARSAPVHQGLNIQFDHHEVIKVYHAIVCGEPGWKDHTARHPLRINVGHGHRTVVDHTRGKPSETTFHVMERFKGFTLLAAMPATGRTHQVRVHASAVGLPLLGDVHYGAPTTDLIGRPALHAWSLTFTHPLTHERLSFTTSYPVDFEEALKELRLIK